MNRADLRALLHDVGLAGQAELLLDRALPSIRLRSRRVGPPVPATYRKPEPVAGLQQGIKALATSGYHHLALADDGTVLAWGSNEDGQLGDGTTTHRRTPVRLPGLVGVRAIAAGGSSSLALLADGSVMAWGDCGQLGDGAAAKSHRIPSPVIGPVEVRSIAVGEYRRGLAIDARGAVWSWGGRTPPGIAPGLSSGAISLAVGRHHALVLMDDGGVLAFGFNSSGQLGDGTIDDPQDKRPADLVSPVTGLTAATAIAAGDYHSLAVLEDGTVVAWGANHFGQLGDGTNDNRGTPGAVDGLHHIVAVAASSCSFALRPDGSVWSWGLGSWGWLGDGTDAGRRTRPARIAGLADVIAMDNTLALDNHGGVWSWGGPEPMDTGPEAMIAVGGTKLGGRPDLPPTVAWPDHDGCPQRFVAQLNLDELAGPEASGLLETGGLLSFFYGPEDSCTVLDTTTLTGLVRRDFPDALADHERYPAAWLHPEVELTLPPPGFASIADLGLSDDELRAYDDARGTVTPTHRVLDHPDPVQPGRQQQADSSRMLLQVDSDDNADMTWGDDGRLYFWIEAADLTGHRFDRCWVTFECY